MRSLIDMITVSRLNRYTSMRVHGTSTHVQPDAPPDSPSKFLNVERRAEGTLISSNYPAHMSVHFSIPTPLTVERTESLFTLSGLSQANTPVFKGSSVMVVRVQLFLNPGGNKLGPFRVMDGNQTIAKGNMDDLFILIPSDDVYIEESFPMNTYTLNLNKRVYTALGVTFELGFTSSFDPSQLLLIGAKAIFLS